MNWLFFALLTAFSFGLYNFFIKVASGSINQILGAVLLQLVAVIAGLAVLAYLKISNQNIEYTTKGIYYSCLAGLFVGIAEILTFYVFSKGVPASVGTPVIIGGSIVAATILGILFLKEQMSLIQILGILMITGGVALLSLNAKH